MPTESFQTVSIVMRLFLFCALLLTACSSDTSDSTTGTLNSDAGTPDADAYQPDAAPWQERASWIPAEPYDCTFQPGTDDALTELLDAVGIPIDFGIPISRYEEYGGTIASDPTRKSWFHMLQENPLELPCFAASAATRADLAHVFHHPLTAMISDGAALLDVVVEVGGGWPNRVTDNPLISALDLLNGGSTWMGREDVLDAIPDLPGDVATSSALILLGLHEAIALRQTGLEAIGPPEEWQRIYDSLPGTYLPSVIGALDPAQVEDLIWLAASDEAITALYEGGARLAQAIDEAELTEIESAGYFSFEAPTPFGKVIIRGNDNDYYDPLIDESLLEPILLLIDTGGADEYLIPAGANGDATHPASVFIDLGGDDFYGYTEIGSRFDVEGLLVSDAAGRYEGDTFWGPFSLSQTPRQGAGVLGYGFLLDLGAGNDNYRTLRAGQGFGALGVGLLYDDGGTDSYIAEAGSQGAGFAGIGILIDSAGDDSYRAFYSSQGHSRPNGYGLLYDASGNDHYELVPSEPQVYNWFEGFQDNLSMGQGGSTGYRADCYNGVCLSGGFAMLRDATGDDAYWASVMSQGEGYWMGMGVLADASGNDQYEALVYSQGSTQHFALAAFLEGGGDDTYNVESPIQHALPGLSHDFSVTAFVDDGGDDIYFGPSGSFGAAKCHGMVIFVDNGGDDTYDASDDFSLGWARDYDGTVGNCGDWTDVPTYGLFVDSSGTDSYTKPTIDQEGNNSLWITDDLADTTALELSGGIDTESGPVFWRAYGESH